MAENDVDGKLAGAAVCALLLLAQQGGLSVVGAVLSPAEPWSGCCSTSFGRVCCLLDAPHPCKGHGRDMCWHIPYYIKFISMHRVTLGFLGTHLGIVYHDLLG